MDRLYLASLLILALMLWLIASQRRHRLELARRAAVDKQTAAISTLFLGAPPEAFDEALDRAVEQVGRGSRLDRVTLVRVGHPRLHRWTRVPDQPPPDLERLLLDVVDEAEETAAILGRGNVADGLVRIPSLAQAPGHASRLLAATGTRSWAGFVFRRDGAVCGLLCFEAASPRAGWPLGGAAVFWPLARMFEQALDRERAIAERRVLQDRLAHAQRLEAAGSLASGIAHNFNNIVGAVLGHAELAAEAAGRGESPSCHIDEIRRAADRASDLVRDMLNLGRRSPVSDVLDLGRLVRDTVSLVRPSLPQGVVVALAVESAPAEVLGRAGDLQQIVLNLVRNAAQACVGTGSIEVALARTFVQDPKVMQVGQLRRGEHLCFRVGDNGIGMDTATLDRVFEPFFTTRRAGTGLGLATVADIIREHGGAAHVSSAPGRGTIFQVWLPSAGSQTGTALIRGDGQIVLVLVDGDQDRLYRLEDMVAALGYEPDGHSALGSALETLRNGAPIDAVLIDATGVRREAGARAASVVARTRPHILTLVLGNAEDAPRLPSTAGMELHPFDPEAGAGSLALALGRVPRLG